jgi:hypothetical protein
MAPIAGTKVRASKVQKANDGIFGDWKASEVSFPVDL